MKKHSTGALAKEQKAAQDARYKQNHRYDYVIVGTGMAALTVGCLLANAGKKICMLEAHDLPGGYAHSFNMGEYWFCAQVHYIWGCAPGGYIYAFLKRIGLEKDITFELFNPDMYDRMVMPDGKAVGIPYGYDKLIENIERAYPGSKRGMQRFTKVLEKITAEFRSLPDRKIKWYEILTKGWQCPNLLRYRHKTLQYVFDQCKLTKEAQAILIANCGDMMSPPEELSIFAFVGLFGGYNAGAYYPTKHFKYMTERLAKFIEEKGGHIYYETEVSSFTTEGNRMKALGTKDGKTFSADRFICNMDPQAASHLIGRDKFPDLKPLSYTYSPSGVMIYLGLDGIDLRQYGFGKYNTWHLEQWDMNTMWKDQRDMRFEKPWIFMSTPSLHTDYPGTTPPGGQILEVATYAPFEVFDTSQKRDYKEYNRIKQAVANRMLEIVEEKYIPNLKQYIKVKVIGTPTTNVDFCHAPRGNAYGALLTPEQIGTGRLKADTPFENFWWCNATSGYGGIHGTTSTGLHLYMDLTRDYFYTKSQAPTTDELLRRIKTAQ